MLHTIVLELPLVMPQNPSCDCCVAHLVEALSTRAGIATAHREHIRIILEVDPQLVADAEAESLARAAGLSIVRRYDHPTFAVAGVEKAAGAEIFAGSLNGDGAIEARVTRPAQDSTLARIIHLVEAAQSHKAPAQRFIDVFARYYTPMVLVLAVLVATLPPLASAGAWTAWLYRALVLLVIACPCALVISTPVSIVSAISAGARHGVLFKGGGALEIAGGLRALAFDKTGTLTLGQPVVTDVIVFADDPLLPANGAQIQPDSAAGDQLLGLVAGVERRSTHPLARAIIAEAEARGLRIPAAIDLQSQPGRGATANVAGQQVTIGNRTMFADAPLSPAVEARLVALEQSGRTAMLVGYDGALRGIIAVADTERAESRAAVAALKRMGIAPITMLTGDSAYAAERVAASVGIDKTYAGLLPQTKLAVIDDLLAAHNSVGMVGDGVNDAPALPARRSALQWAQRAAM